MYEAEPLGDEALTAYFVRTFDELEAEPDLSDLYSSESSAQFWRSASRFLAQRLSCHASDQWPILPLKHFLVRIEKEYAKARNPQELLFNAAAAGAGADSAWSETAATSSPPLLPSDAIQHDIAGRVAAKLTAKAPQFGKQAATLHEFLKEQTLRTKQQPVYMQALLSLVCEYKPDLVPFFASFEFLDPNQQHDFWYSSLERAYRNIVAHPQAFVNVGHEVAYVLACLASCTPTRAPSDPQALSTSLHLANQFGRQYHGDAPGRFLNFVDQQSNHWNRLATLDPQPYFRGTPIVQSSGTGKTRMVLELRHRAALLYVCFRNVDNNANAGYPFADKAVRNYFVKAHSQYPLHCDLQVACFLSAWFDLLADRLGAVQDSHRRPSLDDLNRLDTPNREGRNQDRDRFFQTVSDKAADKLATAAKKHLLSTYNTLFDGVLQHSVIRLSHELATVYQNFAKAQPGHTPPVFVAFDECVEMNVSGHNSGITQLNSLRRAWNYIGDLQKQNKILPFWLILLSTSSSAAHLVEHVTVESSFRRQSGAPIPTFVGLGFDVLAHERPPLLSARQASSFDELVKYGRPLWSSIEPTGFWETALIKLRGRLDFDDSNHFQCFSVLASRLALRLVPIHRGGSTLFGEFKILADNVVDRHMRILTDVTADAAMHVDSPSEPVLAIAASLTMLSYKSEEQAVLPQQDAKDRYGAILECFKRKCLLSTAIGLLKGSNGELDARIVLMAAWDAVKRNGLQSLEDALPSKDSLPLLEDRAAQLARPVLLNDILANLAVLEPDHIKVVHDRIDAVCLKVAEALGLSSTATAADDQEPAAHKGSQLRMQAWTNYTHFDLLEQPITQISPEYLWYCWKRGVALQMAHLQGGVDGIIPVFVGDLDMPFAAWSSMSASLAAAGQDTLAEVESFAARHMTYVSWEAKNRTTAQPYTADSKQTAILTPWRDGKTAKTPDGKGAFKKQAILAGPSLMRPLGVDESGWPLTERGMLTILTDLGTTSSFASRPGRPSPNGGKRFTNVDMIAATNCPRLSIRGVESEQCYPCLDTLQIRPIMQKLVHDVSVRFYDEGFNKMASPLWNVDIRPDSQVLPRALGSARTPAATDADERMDMD